jgi:hypothetical protein
VEVPVPPTTKIPTVAIPPRGDDTRPKRVFVTLGGDPGPMSSEMLMGILAAAFGLMFLVVVVLPWLWNDLMVGLGYR